MSLLSLNVTVVGSVRPSGPVKPFDLAMAVVPYLGKEFTVSIQSSKTPQDLADMIDILLGVSPGETFEETLIETSTGIVYDNAKSLEANGIRDGAIVNYKFVLKM
jgi:hypothetical protein